jgi:hypothetical protein
MRDFVSNGLSGGSYIKPFQLAHFMYGTFIFMMRSYLTVKKISSMVFRSKLFREGMENEGVEAEKNELEEEESRVEELPF